MTSVYRSSAASICVWPSADFVAKMVSLLLIRLPPRRFGLEPRETSALPLLFFPSEAAVGDTSCGFGGLILFSMSRRGENLFSSGTGANPFIFFRSSLGGTKPPRFAPNGDCRPSFIFWADCFGSALAAISARCSACFRASSVSGSAGGGPDRLVRAKGGLSCSPEGLSLFQPQQGDFRNGVSNYRSERDSEYNLLETLELQLNNVEPIVKNRNQ